MFSNSQSYLGGANAGRPGGAPYGQPLQQQQQQPQPQQQSYQQGGFQPQPTGYAGGMQPQMAGYPGQPSMQSQPTGYPGQPQQQPQQMAPQATGFPGGLAPQYTGYPPQNQSFQNAPAVPQIPQQFQTPQSSTPVSQQSFQSAPAPQKPQPTGMTSSQMADSFRSSAPSQAPSTAEPTLNSKIPNIRLSFITAQDQAKFEQLFKSAVGNSQAMSGDQARDLLMRSKLPGNILSDIWLLADTTRSGQLLFPEFALAMYLCNLKISGQALPAQLPDKIKNEVSSMVDIISFAVPDEQPTKAQNTHVPSFEVHQPTPQQPSSSQLLSQLVSQPTGYMQPQQTQYQQPQQTGYPQNPQPTGYSGPAPPMPPMPTGFNQPQQAMAPLNAQPTGRPGQWGLVNTPASGLPNIDALRQQMMPQSGREGGFTTTGLQGNATVPWAITKDEKKIYDDLFRAWDGFGKGTVTGSQAIEIFGQSGLEKSELEKIWTLSDPGNKGKLDLDEFAVAMHLIYRRLNGYPVPNRLPPELVPPSTRNLAASLGSVRTMLSRDAEERKSAGQYLEPQATGVSYLKNRSFQGSGNSAFSRKDGTVFKNNDDSVGYRSSARRRAGGDPDRSPSPQPDRNDDLSLDQLRKKIKEKQVLLDAMDFQDTNAAEQDELLDRKDRRDAEDLYGRIRRIQEDIDSHPNSAFKTTDSGAERRALTRQLQNLTDRLPQLASDVRRTERTIAETRIELFRLKDAKAHPSSSNPIVGTGPGGAVTESDRLKARAKALMQQRSAALSGKPVPASGDDDTGAAQRLEDENKRVRAEREANDQMVGDVEEGVAAFSKGVEEGLKEGAADGSSEHEKRRWEEGLGVEDEVRNFIYDLQRSSRAARIRRDDDTRTRDTHSTRAEPATRRESPAAAAAAPVAQDTPARAASASPAGGSYASYKTPEERAAFIKQQAEARMAERLAALGLRAPGKSGETAAQRAERERAEREARVKQAEADDAKREQERQRRLADEQITPPAAAKKGPPPPPSRKGVVQKPAEQDSAERALREQQQAQEEERKALEDDARRQEQELEHEREAAAARQRALEEQVRQGKIKKEEEKRRKAAAREEAKVKEDRLAAQRAELEAARKREEELQKQLAALEEDSSDDDDDEGPMQITPNTEPTPSTSQELSRSSATSPPPAPPLPTIAEPRSEEPAPSVPAVSVTSPLDPATNNPFFKKMQSSASDTPTPPAAAAAPAPTSASDNNPFFRMSQSQSQAPVARAPSKDDDDWSVVSSDDDEDDEPRGAGGAKHLASILFGAMGGPPRPLSAAGESAKSPVGGSIASPPPQATPSAPPPPPPMPEASGGPPLPPPMPNGSSAPGGPPPPPPMPAGAAPAAPPPPPLPAAAAGGGGDRSALLGQIQAGRGLRKVQTKDSSESSVKGRVL